MGGNILNMLLEVLGGKSGKSNELDLLKGLLSSFSPSIDAGFKPYQSGGILEGWSDGGFRDHYKDNDMWSHLPPGAL